MLDALLLDRLSEDAQEVFSTDFADFVGRETCLQQSIDDNVVETSGHTSPGSIGTLTGSRLLLARLGTS